MSTLMDIFLQQSSKGGEIQARKPVLSKAKNLSALDLELHSGQRDASIEVNLKVELQVTLQCKT